MSFSATDWTRPALKPRLTLSPSLKRYHDQALEVLHSILRRNGCQVVNAHKIDREGKETRGIHYTTTHMVGSCRMADDKGHGVTDAQGQVFDYPGLYVTDGAAIPSSLAVNTSLTILANAERVADHLVSRYGRHRDVAGSILARHDFGNFIQSSRTSGR